MPHTSQMEAIGTWVGSVGTIAAIVWAVHTFQHETRLWQQALDRETQDRLKRDFDVAEKVRMVCSGGMADSLIAQDIWMVNSVWIRLINGTAERMTIEHFDLPGINFRENVMHVLPSTLTGGEALKSIDVEPVRVSSDEVSDRGPLKNAVPVLRYRISGVTWERTGDDPPIRV